MCIPLLIVFIIFCITSLVMKPCDPQKCLALQHCLRLDKTCEEKTDKVKLAKS